MQFFLSKNLKNKSEVKMEEKTEYRLTSQVKVHG